MVRNTSFAADDALESLIEASSSGEQAPSSRRPSKATADSSRHEGRCALKPGKEPSRPPSDAVEATSKEQQLNVDVGDDVYTALSLRKAYAKSNGIEEEKSFVGIVDTALRKHLAKELEAVRMMNGGGQL